MANTALRRGSQEEGNSDYFTGCPIGGGFMWFGLPTKIPVNCRVCDNTTLAIADFTKLHENLGGAWGTSGANLNIPDLRGRFPRGVAGGSANDPDRASRVAANTGGNAGDAVGSVQEDTNKLHTHIQNAHQHAIHGIAQQGVNSGQADDITNGNNFLRNTEFATAINQDSGGNESRPKNANVYFVIRVS